MKKISAIIGTLVSLCLCILGCTSHVETKAGVDILMQDTLIQAGSTFSVQADREITITNFQCRLLGEVTDTIIAETQDNILVVGDFALSDRQAWQRNERMFVRGEVRLTYTDADGDYLIVREVAYPFRPCQVKVQRFDVTTDLETKTVKFRIQAYSNGSSRYVVSYKGFHDLLPTTDTIEATLLDKHYEGISATDIYHLYIYGLNEIGKNQSDRLMIVPDQKPKLQLRTTTDSATFLKYYLYFDGEQVPDTEVESVEIILRTGEIVMRPTALQGELIDITSLEKGKVYLLLVTMTDGQKLTYSFRKYK